MATKYYSVFVIGNDGLLYEYKFTTQEKRNEFYKEQIECYGDKCTFIAAQIFVVE